jgi:transketolase
MIAMRAQAIDTVAELFEDDPRVAVVLAEISVDRFKPVFAHDPARAVNVGIMEQTMVGVAAGYALEGFHPVIHTITPFVAERALEQLKLDFGYQGLGGLFISAGAAYDYGQSGGTHHSPGGVQALSSIPGIEILLPGSPTETDSLVRETYANGRPTYLRTSVVENAAPLELAPGGLTVVQRGRDVTVIAAGPFLSRTLAAVDGLDATVLYATTLAPLDADTLAREAAPAAEIVLVEPLYEGTTTAQVSAALAHRPTRLLSIGVPRRFIKHYGTSEQHDRDLGLDVHGIRERILGFI